jgi:hypothetical protein
LVFSRNSWDLARNAAIWVSQIDDLRADGVHQWQAFIIVEASGIGHGKDEPPVSVENLGGKTFGCAAAFFVIGALPSASRKIANAT